MAAGIYSITNTVNGKRYIGSSAYLSRRRSAHFIALRRNQHHSAILQRAFNKYGEDKFRFTILAVVDNASALLALEQRYFDLLKPEYNILPIAGSNRGRKLSMEVRKKLSDINKGKRGGQNNNFYGKHHSIEARERIRATSRERLQRPETQAALAKGHGWNRGVAFGADSRKRMSDAKPKKAVRRIDPITGETKDYRSIAEAGLDGFHRSHVGECAASGTKTHKGYYWEVITPCPQ